MLRCCTITNARGPSLSDFPPFIFVLTSKASVSFPIFDGFSNGMNQQIASVHTFRPRQWALKSSRRILYVQGYILRATAAAENILGYARGGLLGACLYALAVGSDGKQLQYMLDLHNSRGNPAGMPCVTHKLVYVSVVIAT